MWEGHGRSRGGLDEEDGDLLGASLAHRSGRALEHVFRLLALIHPEEPIRIALRGLHTDDASIRGTALEYLENVLPEAIRTELWPLLDAEQAARARARSEKDLREELLRSEQAIATLLDKETACR